jgi:hypothetical protein
MKYAVEMGSGAIIYIQNFINITDAQTACILYWIIFTFQSKESELTKYFQVKLTLKLFFSHDLMNGLEPPYAPPPPTLKNSALDLFSKGRITF